MKIKSQLFLGPMSKNSVDACINLAKRKKIEIFLIASRRQIETKLLGGGYVNNWTTEKIAKYVKNKNIILCRDHGGPWQGSYEINKKQNLKKAMIRAKKSYLQDIKNDFKILHIDTSLSPKKKLSFNSKIKRLKDLYEYCYRTAKKYRKKILFEVGWESENGEMHNISELKKFISNLNNFCRIKKITKPKYITLKTGTKVFEDKNIGVLFKNYNKKSIFKKNIFHLKKCIDICHRNDFLVKEHNSDYLSYSFLKLRPDLKIDGVNIAPELGTYETKIIFKLLKKAKMKNLYIDLVNLLVNSKKWVKWTNPKSKISNEKKAILAGHYMFNDKNFLKIKMKLNKFLIKSSAINLDKYIQNQLQKKIKIIAKSLNLNY